MPCESEELRTFPGARADIMHSGLFSVPEAGKRKARKLTNGLFNLLDAKENIPRLTGKRAFRFCCLSRASCHGEEAKEWALHQALGM